MSDLKVNFGGLSTAAADIQTGASRIESRLGDMDQALQPLRADWSGEASTSYEAARANGLEGIMAKRLSSTYEPGRRSAGWRKCKVRRQQEVVIGGWTSGEGSRSSSLGSLLIGVHDPDAPGRPLRYAGRVGTGLTDETLAMLGRELEPLTVDAPPFDPPPPRVDARVIRWVRPELVAEVEFGEWTPDGRMRHPSYLGLRIDKSPTDVIREPTP